MRRLNYYLTIAGIFVSIARLSAQSSDQNYVSTHVAKVANQSGDLSEVSDEDSVSHSVQYFDGLGRPIESVMVKGSPSSLDILSFTTYDAFGRQGKQYLPYAHNSQSNGDFVDKPTFASLQEDFYTSKLNSSDDGVSAYSSVLYENSPLNRVLETYAPGGDWVGSSLGVENQYLINTEEDMVILWEIEGNSLRTGNFEYYDAGELQKNVTIDENGNEVHEYLDKLGQVILKEVETDDPDHPWYRTYYVYDDFGLLRFVIPPKTSLRMEDQGNEPVFDDWDDQMYFPQSTSITSADIAGKSTPLVVWVRYGEVLTLADGFVFDAAASGELIIKIGTPPPMPVALQQACYEYRYDGRKRMVAKRVPETGWVYMVYDQWDRLVLTQDSLQREEGQWLFTSYDALNRPVITGLLHAKSSSTDLHDVVEGLTTAERYLTYDGSTARHGYNAAAFPYSESADIAVDEVHTVTYYDNYTFKSDWSGFDFEDELGVTSDELVNTNKGQVTGGKTLILGTNTYLKSVNYYDDRYRLIQSKSDDPQGNVTRMTNVYDFTGKVLQSKTTYSGLFSKSIYKWYDYDHMDRLMSVQMRIGESGNPKVTIQENSYNEIGELIEKNIYTPEDNVLQSTDYDYNIRGWLTKVNEADLSNDGSSDPIADVFGMELLYNDAGNDYNQYNGNIGRINWSTSGTSGVHNYRYTYDPMNRLKGADYGLNSTFSNTRYDVSNLNYDANGNILSLTRRGLNNSGTAVNIDELSYDYAPGSNQLRSVGEGDAGNASLGFSDGASEEDEGEYSYDGNGNMIIDLNKGISNITYNHLNLPEQVTMGGTTIEYDYLADGTKIANRVIKGGETTTRLYQGGLVFENNALDHILMEEGKVVPFIPGNSDIMDYQYFLKDHLGNVRSVVHSPNIYNYLATMEASNSSTEESYFAKVGETRVMTSGANTGSYVSALSNARPIGPTLALKVNKGDVVNMSAWGKTLSGDDATEYGGVDALVSGLVGMFTGTSYLGENSSTVTSSLNEGFSFLAMGENSTATGHLTYMVFDEGFNLVTAGFKEVTASNYTALAETYEVEQSGIIIVYLSYYSTSDDQVYFDDFQVTLETSSVIQTDDYYPFGLTFNSYTSGTENLYKYNGKELQQETGWYDYGARMYMPDLGRWGVVDRKADDVMQVDKSPYQYSWNNPVNLTDPDGNCPWCVGAVVGALVEYGTQVAGNVIANGGVSSLEDLQKVAYDQVDFTDVAVEAAVGAATAGLGNIKNAGKVLTTTAKILNNDIAQETIKATTKEAINSIQDGKDFNATTVVTDVAGVGLSKIAPNKGLATNADVSAASKQLKKAETAVRVQNPNKTHLKTNLSNAQTNFSKAKEASNTSVSTKVKGVNVGANANSTLKTAVGASVKASESQKENEENR